MDKLKSLVGAVNAALNSAYPSMVHKLALYLTKQKTQQALLKPIKINIIEAHGQLQTVLDQHFSADDAHQIPLRRDAALQSALDIDVAPPTSPLAS